jgi:hypothetical protein
MRGVRLVDYQSLMDYINSHAEPSYVGRRPQISAAVKNLDDRSVQKLALDQSLRVIISIRVEEEAENECGKPNETMNI